MKTNFKTSFFASLILTMTSAFAVSVPRQNIQVVDHKGNPVAGAQVERSVTFAQNKYVPNNTGGLFGSIQVVRGVKGPKTLLTDSNGNVSFPRIAEFSSEETPELRIRVSKNIQCPGGLLNKLLDFNEVKSGANFAGAFWPDNNGQYTHGIFLEATEGSVRYSFPRAVKNLKLQLTNNYDGSLSCK